MTTLKEVVSPLVTICLAGLADREKSPARVAISMLFDVPTPLQRVMSVVTLVTIQPEGRRSPAQMLSGVFSPTPLRLRRTERLLLELKQRVKSVATSRNTHPGGMVPPAHTDAVAAAGSPLRFRSM